MFKLSPKSLSLSHDEDKLLKAANTAKIRAFAIYSGIKIGAALLTDDGKVYAGCNIETALYHAEPGGYVSLAGYHSIHAEEAAVAIMTQSGQKRIKKILTVTDSSKPLMPCPLCAQVLKQFASNDPEVIGVSANGKSVRTRLSKLLKQI